MDLQPAGVMHSGWEMMDEAPVGGNHCGFKIQLT